MTGKELANLCFQIDDEEPVVILNENAPIKGAVAITNAFVMKAKDGGKQLILTYENREREGK